MVLGNSGVTRCEGITVISQVLGVVTSAAAVLSLMHEIFPGGDGRRRIVIFAEASGGSGGGGSGLFVSSSNVGIAIAVTAMAGLALAATLVYSSRRGSLKSPWSRRRRKHALLAKQWKSSFDADGKLSDGGVKFLKKIRTGGVEPSIRAEVWPFLLGMYDVKSSKKERDNVRAQKRRGYVELRKQCRQISKRGERSFKLKEISGNNSNEDGGDISQVLDSPSLDEVASARPSVSMEIASLSGEVVQKDGRSVYLDTSRELVGQEEDDSVITNENVSEAETDSSDSDSSDDPEDTKPLLGSMETEDNHLYEPVDSTLEKLEARPASYNAENFATWQRIIRLDAVRANAEWIIYSPSQAAVSEAKAQQLAESVGLKDYDHLEPCRIYHAARLVSILEAYALYDSEIGYCQGMSDLLSPIISVIEEDHVAFWCFVGFMRKARHNFRLDEVGIRRQLNIVSKIIKCKDSHLYKHLEKLQAEDCFFVYRMVVVLFRRELTFEQTLCLWEVMWADQAAIRAGIVKSAWRRMRLRAPPTDDLLLYAIAACVLQKRKLIIENYSSMDEIMRDCNSMAGHLDVWKLLDDAHDLVVTLHDKI
ncbi:hypothetical protein Pfo_009985 [Paulownia fortunei]|nr:hypothetical protein Pfo_009985 [Paulownia fortunei]